MPHRCRYSQQFYRLRDQAINVIAVRLWVVHVGEMDLLLGVVGERKGKLLPTKWQKSGKSPPMTREREKSILVLSQSGQREGRSSERAEGGFFAARIFRLEVVKWNVKHILPG